jgi:hypothetical protein
MIQRIDPGETKSVSLFAHFDRSGVARLSAELDDTDALGIDDRRFAVAHVRDSVRVLCVDGAPSSKPYQSETDFLVAAFKMKSQTRKASSVVVHKIPWLELQSSMLQDYQVIILANVRDVPKRMARALGSFVERGGGLIVFLGDNINPAVANLRLASGEVALLPGELLEPVGDSEKRQQEFHLQIALPEHPLVQPLRLFPPEFMRGVSCYRFFKTRLLPNGRAILSLAGDAGPLLAEKAFGQGKVLLFTTTADRAWTNSVVHPFFPILMQQAVTYLTSAAFERQVTTGMPFVLPMPQDLRRSSVVFTDPQGNESRIRVTERSSARVVEYPLPKWPGFYHTNLPLRPHSPAASAASAPKDESLLASERLIVAANLESSESDVRSLSGKDLSSALEGLNVKIFEPGGNLPGLIQEGRVGRELWKPLLFLALLMLAAELGLGFWFARKMKQDWSLSFGGGQLAPRRSSERESAAISIESS